MKKSSKKGYKPVVYGVLAGVLIIVLFSVLYTSQFGRVGMAFQFAGDPTIYNVMAGINSSSAGARLVIPRSSTSDLNQALGSFGKFGVYQETALLDNETSSSTAGLIVVGTAQGANINSINTELLPAWECSDDKAVIKVDSSGNGEKLLIIGKTVADLDAALEILENYTSYQNQLTARCIKLFVNDTGGNQLMPCVFMTRTLPSTMRVGQQATISLIADIDEYSVIDDIAFSETFPVGWTFGTMNPKLSPFGDFIDNTYADFGGLTQDTTFTYTIIPTTSGLASFSGSYVPSYRDANEICPIFGNTQIQVETAAGAAPNCSDNIKNQNEGDVDCGGVCATKCATGKTCSISSDCMINNCVSGICTVLTSCTNGVKDGQETDIDCGGTCTTKCATGKICSANSDCASNNCSSGICTTAPAAATLSSTFAEVKSNPASYKTVIGGQATTEDNIASLDINGKFRITRTVIDNTLTSPLSENLVIIGGPCANKAAGIVMGKPWIGEAANPNCTQGFTLGEGKLKVYENNGKKQIIIAGFSGMDTRVAARIVVDYENRNLNNNTVKTKGTLTSPLITP